MKFCTGRITKQMNIPEVKCGCGILENKAPPPAQSVKAVLDIVFVTRLHCGCYKLWASVLVL